MPVIVVLTNHFHHHHHFIHSVTVIVTHHLDLNLVLNPPLLPHSLTTSQPNPHFKLTFVSTLHFVSICSISPSAYSPSTLSSFVITRPFYSTPHPLIMIASMPPKFIATFLILIGRYFLIIAGSPMTQRYIHALLMLLKIARFLSIL